jgi:hypothetical protein
MANQSDSEIWLDRRMDSTEVRSIGFDPGLYTRVFYTVLPAAAKREDGYFSKLIYHDDHLLLSSLEKIMLDGETFDYKFQNLYRIKEASTRFIHAFVPAYREYMRDR